MTKNLGGRPRIVLTEEQTAKVERLASHFTTEQIADYFGISHVTFQNIRKRQPEVSFAYKRGRAKKILRFAKMLEAKAMGNTKDGDAACIMFYLKTQAGWSQKRYEQYNYTKTTSTD